MNLLDVFILLMVLVFAIQGYRNGIVREVLTIVGVIFAVFIAFQYMNELAEMLMPYFDQPEDVITLISGLIMFTATFVLVLTIAFLIRKFLELIKLNIINRIFGSIFGGLKSAIAVSAILLLFAGFGIPGDETRNDSLTYPYIIQLAPAAFNMVAAAIPGTENFVNRIEETLDETNPIKHLPIF
jgi:membrane protein required for colicin V production